MTIDRLPVRAGSCDCHELHAVADIAAWLHGSTPDTIAPAEQWAARADLWQRAAMSHDEMVSLVRDAGGIVCEHALDATRLADGRVRLNNGLHRWVVAREIGVDLVPVEMSVEGPQSPFAW